MNGKVDRVELLRNPLSLTEEPLSLEPTPGIINYKLQTVKSVNAF